MADSMATAIAKAMATATTPEELKRDIVEARMREFDRQAQEARSRGPAAFAEWIAEQKRALAAETTAIAAAIDQLLAVRDEAKGSQEVENGNDST
jgi:pyruvate carboxylase